MSVHCDEQEIKHILKTSREENQKANITGILVHTHRHFMQYIEGSGKHICILFDKIKEDNRHHDILLCHFSSIETRVFPDWQMGYKDLTKNQLYPKKEDSTIGIDALNNLTQMLNTSEDIEEVLKIFL